MFAKQSIMTMSTRPHVKERDSNIELLRIVCMLFILIHHFIVIVLYPDLTVRDGDINPYRIACIVVNGFVYVGVNCFVLISGYYGIKFRIRSLFNLYCICVFYTILSALLKYGLSDFQLSKGFLYTVFLPFSHSKWWFITCYAALFLISPILNKAAQNLSHKEFVLSIVSLTVLNVYLGYYWHLHNINGYNLVHFVFVYLIGAFLSKYPLKKLNKERSMSLYIFGALLWSIITVFSLKWKVPHWVSLHYNNPFVLIASIGLFVYMTKVSIRSRIINIFASSVLAAYLLQGAPAYSVFDHFNQLLICPLHNEVLKIMLMLVLVVMGAVILLVISFLIDRIRILLMKPVWWFYNQTKSLIRGIQLQH